MAPRKRTKGPEWLPSRCYMGRVSYEFHPKSGGSIKLGALTEPKEIILAKYFAALALHEEPKGAFSELVRGYFAGSNYKALQPRTKKDYAAYGEKVCLVFGKVNCHRIKPHHIRKYMDNRKKTALVQANREHSFMSAVFSWAYENGRVKINPCVGVRKFKEEPRDRYIEDWEYDAMLEEARKNVPLMAAAMEISYCCAARQGDVWGLRREQLRETGIFIRQGKTGVKQIKEWNPRLRAAVDLALSVQKVVNINLVFCDSKGNHPAQGTLRNWFGKYKAKAKENHQGAWVNDFTFHDIKAKSISDYEGNKQEFSGHKTASQVQTYDRKIKVVPTLK